MSVLVRLRFFLIYALEKNEENKLPNANFIQITNAVQTIRFNEESVKRKTLKLTKTNR